MAPRRAAGGVVRAARNGVATQSVRHRFHDVAPAPPVGAPLWRDAFAVSRHPGEKKSIAPKWRSYIESNTAKIAKKVAPEVFRNQPRTRATSAAAFADASRTLS